MSIRAHGSRPHHPSRYLGQVATRCLIPTRLDTADTYSLKQRWHRLQDDVTALAVVFPNFWVDASDGGREKCPGTMTKTAALQKADGTVTRLTFGGSNTGSFTGPLGRSDLVAFSGRRGDWFCVREWEHNPGGIAFTAYGGAGSGDFNSPSGRDAFYLTSDPGAAPDFSGGGVIPDQHPGLGAGCAAILAYTNRPSVFLPGDSRQMGWTDTNDASGDLGEVARAVGPSMAYINAGVDSNGLDHFIANHDVQLQLAQFCSHVVIEGGAANFATDTATLIRDRDTVMDLMAGRIVYETTLSPKTMSGDGFVTQTPSTTWAEFNALVRAGRPGVSGVFDTARTMSPDDIRWRPGYTGDGVHALQAGNLAAAVEWHPAATAMMGW